MVEWIQNLMSQLGYLGIVLLMLIENVFPPIPSELILPLAGFTASRGDLNLVLVILSGMLGSVLGALVLYWLGLAVGEERLVRWADRYGRWLTLSGRDIRKADDWFDTHGWKAVFVARVIPGVRSLISLPAGMSEMPMRRFLVYTALGTTIWSTLLSVAGYVLGENYHLVEQYVEPVGKVVLGLLVLTALVWLWSRMRRGARRQT